VPYVAFNKDAFPNSGGRSCCASRTKSTSLCNEAQLLAREFFKRESFRLSFASRSKAARLPQPIALDRNRSMEPFGQGLS